MKTLALIISMVTLVTFSSMGQNTDVDKLLQNTESRDVIFNTILNDNDLMIDFMKTMKQNKHAMMMMQNNQMPNQSKEMGMGDKKPMMDSGAMMKKMQNNPEMMKKMMSNMMTMCEHDSTMRNNMANMMSKHPEMMQMCMEKMHKSNMMQKDGNMKMMDSENSMGDSNHSHKQ